jgi:hypothetical protein
MVIRLEDKSMKTQTISQEDIEDFLEKHNIQTQNVRPDLAEEIQNQLEASLETVPADETVKSISGSIQSLEEYLRAIFFVSFDRDRQYVTLPDVTGRDIERYKQKHNLSSKPKASAILSDEQQSLVLENISSILDSVESHLESVGPLDTQTDDPRLLWFQSINVLVRLLRHHIDNNNFDRLGGFHDSILTFSEKPTDKLGLKTKVVKLTSKFDNSIVYDFGEHYDEEEIDEKYGESISFLQGIMREAKVA